MIVLGIADSVNSGAAIVVDGHVMAAVNEERINRQKMSMGFPRLSIAEVLRISGIDASAVDRVAVATTSLFWRPDAVPYEDYFRAARKEARQHYLSLGAQLSTIAGDFKVARTVYYQIKRLISRTRKRAIPKILRRDFGITGPTTFFDHHLCHAASAYYTSGYEEATVVTHDGAGDGVSSRVYRVRRGEFEALNAIESYHSVGNYYSYVTHLCGFEAHKHEGKITGLAAAGEPTYLDFFRKFVLCREGKIENTGRAFDHSAIAKLRRELPSDYSPCDLSASIQTLLEEIVSEYCRYWIETSAISNLALGGGVFANVRLNQRLHELPNTERIFVHPGMGDEGLALGAALFEANTQAGYRETPVIKDVYYGDEFSDSSIKESLRTNGLESVSHDNVLEIEVAKLLAQGNVVARFDGRMEYGPRALGNRSILVQASDRTVNDWLNKRLLRTEFMPFAPVTLWEERDACYENIAGAEDSARFMTMTFDCTSEMRLKCPAVCHLDDTARPQLIREEDNPGYYRILKEYQKITGLSSLINTSFNVHEEPIVYTPDDAIRAFQVGHLDYLLIGNNLVKNNEASTDAYSTK